MNDLKNRIEEEMKQVTLPEDFGKKTIEAARRRTKKRNFQFPVAAAMLTIILTGTTCFAGYLIHQKITVNQKELPQMEAMEVREHKQMADPKDGAESGSFRNYQELKDKIEIPLLDTEYANDAFQEILYHKSPEEDYELIRVLGYIPDKRDGTYVTGYEIDGEEILTAVSMNVYIALEESALETKLNDEYTGDFSFVEQYTSEQGYTVNVIRTEEDPACYILIFVADGVRYELIGVRELEEMKQIVDSMKY